LSIYLDPKIVLIYRPHPVYRSQTHECGNWDWGRAVLFLGIHKSKFLCSELASPRLL
jgi:hypothetical protein